MENLFVSLSELEINENTSLKWSYRPSSEFPQADVSEGTIQELASVVSGSTRIVLLVPTEYVLCTEVELPVKRRSQLVKAIPFALEEELVEDITKLHFIPGTTTKGKTPVLVVNESVLEAWKAAFVERDMRLHRVVADLMIVPHQATEWGVMIDGERALVRTDEYAGFETDTENLDVMLQSMLSDEEMTPPEKIRVWLAEGMQAQLKLPQDAPHVDVEANNDGVHGLLAQGWTDKAAQNLLSGKQSDNENIFAELQPWRWVAALVLGCMLVSLCTLIIQHRQLSQQQVALDNQIKQIANTHFPGATGNIRVRMERLLNGLTSGQSAADTDFLPLLEKATSAYNVTSGDISIDSISYANESLTLQMGAKSLSDLEKIKNDMAQATGMNAELRSVSSDTNAALAQIKLTR